MNENNAYPAWIDDFAESIHGAFTNMVPGNWSPDGFAVLRFLNGTFIQKISEAVRLLKEKNISPAEAAKLNFSPSGLRFSLYCLVLEYQGWEHKDKEQFKETMEYLVAVLYSIAHEDYWIKKKNIVHTTEQIQTILKTTPWQKGTPEIAQELGKLYASSSALTYSLYGDFFPQLANEVYGPYDASSEYGENTILTIKHFLELYPKELWPILYNTKYENLKIYQVYKDVAFSCELIGMHSLYVGDLRTGLVAWAVEGNTGFIESLEEIRELRNFLAETATKQAEIRGTMTKEDIKNKFVEWICYECKVFFDSAGMDWKPTKEMLVALEGKEIPDRLIIDSVPPFDEYISSPEYEIFWLKDMYK